MQPLDDVERRRSLGIYYTPRTAATLLAHWAIRESSDTVLEPSFGGCTILEAAVERLRSLGCTHPASQLFGFDIDDSAFLYLDRLLGQESPANFLKKDFLTVEPGRSRARTVIANPPFVSYHRMNASQRKVLRVWRDQNAPPFPMTASLWAYFLAHSLSFLETGGRLAFVLPFSLSFSDYAEPLLDLLECRFASLSVYRVTEQLFIQAGAEERTVILLAEGYSDAAARHCRYAEHSVPSLSDLGAMLSLPINPEDEGSPLSHCPPVDKPGEVLRRAMTAGAICTLGDVVDVRIGEVIGDTRYFVKRSQDWSDLGIPKRYLHPLVTRTRQIPGLIVSSRDVSSQPSPVPQLLKLSTKPTNSQLRSYLENYPRELASKNITFAKRSPWYAVTYDSSSAAFIGSMAHVSPKILWNSARISCSNGLYKLLPKRGSPWRSLIAAASLTTVFKLCAELHGRVRGAGALKLEPSGVRKLIIPRTPPVLSPNATKCLLRDLDRLVRKGEHDSAGHIADDIFYLSPGIFSTAELNLIRSRWQDLAGERMGGRHRLFGA